MNAPAALFPQGVALRLVAIGEPAPELHPRERELVARAVPKRRREFAAGRACARELLAERGIRDWPLVWDADRAPLWPPGFVGSISHGAERCAVALATRAQLAGVGVDVEGADAVREELWPRICSERERAWLASRADHERRALAAVHFSAKEAVYKALFPLDRRRLGFDDVELELDPDAGRFRARVRGRARDVHGAFALVDGRALTGVALPADEERA